MNTIQQEIISDLRKASHSIKVAVSWLTDHKLINELIEQAKQNVNIEIVVSSDEWNILRFRKFKELQNLGAKVQKWGMPDSRKGHFMHHKFYIIDNLICKSGSYNWSRNAQTNAESLDIPTDITKKIQEFDLVLSDSINFFDEIENPEDIIKELEMLEDDGIQPEQRRAYQAEVNYRKSQKKQADLEQRLEESKRNQEKIEAEKKELEERQRAIELEKREKERASQYKQKENVKAAKTPPTSYG